MYMIYRVKHNYMGKCSVLKCFSSVRNYCHRIIFYLCRDSRIGYDCVTGNSKAKVISVILHLRIVYVINIQDLCN
jgi:hypothetical protein